MLWFLLSAMIVGLLAYAVSYPFCRGSATAMARRELVFEFFFGVFLVCLFAYPTLLGLVRGQAWLSTKAFHSVAIARIDHPGAYWAVESFGAVATALGFVILGSASRKIKKLRPNVP